ncbi:amino acid adenylation domain-containing protein [Longispora urticae]
MTEVSALSAAKRALLERRLHGARTAVADGIPRRAPGNPPLSYAQERVWFMEQLAPGTVAYTIPVVRRLGGPLDADALGRALDALVARHEVLRTRYPATEDGVPVAHVEPVVRVELRRAVGDADARVLAETEEPFDLAEGPVLRALLVELGPEEHVLVLTVHHIACDGWSVDVLTGELFADYAAFAAGDPSPVAEPAVQYGDFAAWQRGRTADRAGDMDYWRAQLTGLEPLALPTDRARPAEQTYVGAAHGFTVDAALTEGVRDLGRAHGATLYMTLLAAWGALLGRYSGSTDFAVGTPVAGRSHREVEPLVGMFVNTLAVRCDLGGEPTFADLLGRARETALDAYAHQELPFEQLVTELRLPRDPARSPLFQVLFAVQNYADPGRTGTRGLAVSGYGWRAAATRFDLELYVAEEADGLSVSLTYNVDLFDAATVERMAGHLDRLLRLVVADPATPVADLDLMTPAERTLTLDTFNATTAEFPDTATLHGLVAAQTARTPDAVAVQCEGRTLTYAELDAWSNRIARRLRLFGVGPEVLVAISAERSVELVAGLLGILKSGGAYVPLDPEYPPERLAFMLEDAAVPVLLTRRKGTLTGPTTLYLEDLAVGSRRDGAALPDLATADSAVYSIYTSGSTGRPKGVVNTHRGIVNRLHWLQREHPIDGADTVLQKTPASFDVSVWEFFWPLISGARLLLARPGGHRDPDYLRDLIASEGVTVTHFVPSMLALFLDTEGAGECTSLRRIICSGEELPVDLALRCLDTLPAALHNLYGPTEASVEVTAWQCTPEALAGLSRVPIGNPIQNIRVYVLDARGNPAPIGVPGELHLAGVGLARGYWNRPELTAERFVESPHGRLYRTGDLARWRPDGTVDFLGRIDDQVKLRGMRIELGEVETRLRALPGVRDAAAGVRDDRLVAWIVGDATGPDLRAALKSRLPDQLVPGAYVTVEALPLSPSGKLDRARLPNPTVGRDAASVFTAPRTPTETLIAAIWAAILKLDKVGVDDDFFDLGGHSLLATQVVARLRREVGAGVSVMDLFRYRTIADLAAYMDVPDGERGPRDLLHELTRPTRTAQLSYVCVPYGGGSAVVYQPLADALPPGHRLFSVAIPGHDVGLDEQAVPFDELAARCVEEIRAKVDGPLVLYGHCGVGSALTVEIARRLEAAGRELDAVYIGAIFPFARPKGVMSRLSSIAQLDGLRSDQGDINWLTSLGVDMGDIEPAQARQIITNMRKDSRNAEEYFTGLFGDEAFRLKAPIVAVAGERDPATDYYQERFKEWHFLTDDSALVVLEEAGHFFLKYRAAELAEIVTTAHRDLDVPLTREVRGEEAGWWREDVSHSTSTVVPTGPQPSMRRFLLIAIGQLASILGSALTEFAIPIWILQKTGSLAQFTLFAALGLVPGLLVAPIAGAVVDRISRRKVMIVGDCAAGGTQLLLGVLVWTGNIEIWHLYTLIVCLSVSLTFQRLAYGSATAQLVPKQYLGHANGVLQMFGGVSAVLVPLCAAGLMAWIGLGGILVFDVVSYVIALTVVCLVRFPRTMAWRRRETLGQEILGGLRYSWGQRGFRAILGFFALLNIVLAPLFIMVTPLVLSFGTLVDVSHVAVASGAGAFLGGLIMTAWGGPRHRRVATMLLCALGLAAFGMVTGLSPTVWVIAVGGFGMSLWITLVNGIYGTIVLVKVPQRFHGRVFALNTVVAWSTLPVGWLVVAPYTSKFLEPMMAPDGSLASTFGAVIGTGAGRGIALMYLLFAVVIAVHVLVSRRTGALARFDDEVPDARPDDLVGFEARQRRLAERRR